ncbi:MAG TPA: hypothetical protein VLQ68_01320, partial [Rhizobiaceae bacterium]|nr:hypothetical protein [Rhizobiaceae bacterium]
NMTHRGFTRPPRTLLQLRNHGFTANINPSIEIDTHSARTTWPADRYQAGPFEHDSRHALPPDNEQ